LLLRTYREPPKVVEDRVVSHLEAKLLRVEALGPILVEHEDVDM